MSTEKRITVREMIAATGSERRRKMMAELMAWIEDHDYADYDIVVHNLAPDKDAGIEESDSAESTVVAWEKALVVALSLGLLEDDDVPPELLKNWENVVRITSPMINVEGEESKKTTVFGGDVVTSVKPDLPEATSQELLKMDRDLSKLNPEEQLTYIEADKAKIKALYGHPGGFIVNYNIGIALLSSDEVNAKRGIVAGWDVRLKFKPLPDELIEAAYQIDEEGRRAGSAFKVGPRLDLATLAAQTNAQGEYQYLDETFGVWVRNVNSPDEVFLPIQVEVMRGLVVGGLLPPHLCLDLLTELDNQIPKGEKPLEPVQVRQEIGVSAMLEKFRPQLDAIYIEEQGEDKVIRVPEGKSPDLGEGITLDKEGKLTHFGEMILKIAILGLVEDDAVLAEVAMNFIISKFNLK